MIYPAPKNKDAQNKARRITRLAVRSCPSIAIIPGVSVVFALRRLMSEDFVILILTKCQPHGYAKHRALIVQDMEPLVPNDPKPGIGKLNFNT